MRLTLVGWSGITDHRRIRTSPRLLVCGLAAVLATAATVAVGAVPDARPATGYRPQITNGADAAAGDWPFMVGLLSSGVEDRFQAQFCGGSLIFDDWVLTAAHCVVSGGELSPADAIDVLAGSVDLTASDGERIAADQIVAHPGYDESTMQNDLALVHLSAPASQGTIQWADFSSADLEAPGSELTLTGWGGLSVDQENQTFATVLQEAVMPVLTDADCTSQVGDLYDPTTMFCAGAPEDDADGGIDACQGDSGGPLFATFPEGGAVQVGIVSFGPTCGYTATAYTRISNYSDWITETTGFAPLDNVTRIAGASRYATAAELALDRFAPGVPAAFVVTGSSFSDALAAAASAAELGAPILLTARDVLSPETLAALEVLVPEQVVVVGGEGAISSGVVAQLAALGAGDVTRIAGIDRYETAAGLSQFTFPDGLGDTAASVFIGSGDSFADVLSGAAPAASPPPIPLLLTQRDALPAATTAELARLAPELAFVLGGTSVVSDATVAAIEALGIEVERIAGDDRYATSAAIVSRFFGLSDEVFVATGTNFPDGLVAGALGLPLLLLPPVGVPAATSEVISAMGVTRVVILGGTSAVSAAQATMLNGLAGG